MSGEIDFHTALVKTLLEPAAWPVGVKTVESIETHISTVLLAGEHAYKIKKPVDLGFLDFSTLERRKGFCEEELRLNGRLAPHIYLEVVPIGGNPGAPRVGAEPAVEYAVKMRRFPSEALLSNPAHLLTAELMDHLAGIVADFHGRIARSPADSDFGSPAAVLSPMEENFILTRGLLEDEEERTSLDRLSAWTREHHRGHRDFLELRRREGYIRECHGDMHLGNIALVDGEVLIFDGIEFNPSLRWIDTINEVAFLVMDLDEKGHPDLAQRFLNSYLQHTGDYAGLRLLRFYQAYRAMVRAKVALIRLEQPGLPVAERETVLTDYGAYRRQAEGYTRPGPPALVITHGVSGSGKSFVTEPLVGELPAIRIRSDVERKRLAGLEAAAHTHSAEGEGIYSREASERTYGHLAELAEEILRAGQTAIVDATFLKRGQRQLFRGLAARLEVPFLILDFLAPEAVLRERVGRRLAEGVDPSEADLNILSAQLAGREALTDEERKQSVSVTPESPLITGELRDRLALR